jgi:hypothetical protein
MGKRFHLAELFVLPHLVKYLFACLYFELGHLAADIHSLFI